MASLSIFQSYLRQNIVNHTAKDELQEKVKEKLQRQSLEKRYGYKLEGDGLLTYKGRIYIPNVAVLGRVVMGEIHQNPYSRQNLDDCYRQKTVRLARNEKGHG